MHLKRDDIEIMIKDEANDVIKELFDSSKSKSQNNLESMKGIQFVFDYVQLLYYKCHKINPNRGRSHIDSSDWIKSKKVRINPINKKDNQCFQYAVTFALNHEEIRKDAKSIKKVRPFINKCNCEGINFPSENDDWKTFEKNNIKSALNVLYAKYSLPIAFLKDIHEGYLSLEN